MKTGTSGSVTSITPAATRSIAATSTRTATGTTTARTDLREVARERRLERLDAVDRGGRDLGALHSVERGRLPPQPGLHQLEAQLRDDPARRVAADDLEAPGGERTAGDDRDEERERHRDGRERSPLERTGGDMRDQHRLAEHESRGGHADGHVRGEKPPNRARTAGQARVEDAHAGA